MFFMRCCIGFGAALWCHLGVTHPTAMASNFRSETIHVVTRLAWYSLVVGGLAMGSEVDLEVPYSV